MVPGRVAIYTPVSLADACAVFAGTDVEPIEVEGLSAGSVNSNFRVRTGDGRTLFVRVFEEQGDAGAAAEVRLLRRLAAHGVPVVSPVFDPPRRLGTKPVQAFPWQSGVHRCQAGVRPEDTFAVGRALAGIHLAGADEPRPSRFGPEGLRTRLVTISRAEQPELAALAEPLGERLDAVLRARRTDAPTGLTHGDLFRDNVLFDDDGLVALLDFESAADGPFAFDLAVTWLAWCYGDTFDRGTSQALFRGYASLRPLTAADRAALYDEVRFAALRFSITRITDYAMRAHLGANVPRDHRRFLARLAFVEERGPRGLLDLVGVES